MAGDNRSVARKATPKKKAPAKKAPAKKAPAKSPPKRKRRSLLDEPPGRQRETVPKVRTLTVLAEIYGISKTEACRWASLDSFPKKKGDTPAKQYHDLKAIGKWVRDGAGDTRMEDEKLLKLKAEREREEIRLAVDRSEVIALSYVERERAQELTQLFALIDKGFHRLAPKLSGLDAPRILDELEKWWSKVRNTLADGL